MTCPSFSDRDDIVDRLYRLDADHCGVIDAFGQAAREIARLRKTLGWIANAEGPLLESTAYLMRAWARSALTPSTED
jgi:hypothetical protein